MISLRTLLLSSLILSGVGWTVVSANSALRVPQDPSWVASRLAASAQRSGWPPRPDAIVELSSRAVNAPASLAPQQLWSAYAVPAGMDLVLTNASILGPGMSLLGGGFKRSGEAKPSLRDSALDPGAPLGWVFPGGTQVVLRNDDVQALPLEYALAGYLVPAN